MKAAAAAQIRLLDLQQEDTALAQVEHRKRALPEHAAITEAKTVRVKLKQDHLAVQTRLTDAQADLDKAEADLVPVRERKVRDQQRLDAGVVSDTKALQGLIDEIEHLGRRISELEDVQLEAMEQVELAAADEARLAEEVGEVESSLRALIASRDEQLAQLDAQGAQHQGVRNGIAAELPADLVGLYDRIRVRAGGLGAAALKGRRCGGCQLEATPTALAGYAAAPTDEVMRCEECERVLVRIGAVEI
jgi:Zn-ribbon protein, possibly nucleic acid-binding